MALHKGDGMLERAMAVSIILALSLVLAACGGSGEETTGEDGAETPAAAQTPTDTPQVEPTPDDNASGEVASSDGEVGAETPAPTYTPASGDGESLDVAEHLREKTMQMWEVYNAHDPDALKAFYEESYWKEKEEEIRSNMGPFKTFGISIKAEETSPPTEIAPGKWEIKHKGSFPLGSVNMVFIYEEFEGHWLLTYAEDE